MQVNLENISVAYTGGLNQLMQCIQTVDTYIMANNHSDNVYTQFVVDSQKQELSRLLSVFDVLSMALVDDVYNEDYELCKIIQRKWENKLNVYNKE